MSMSGREGRRVVAVVPAAGRAKRFGGGKLLAPIAGRPLLDHTLESLLDAGVAGVVVVAADPAAFSTVSRAGDARVTIVRNPDPARGMFSSIQVGVAAASADVLLVLPADMPFVERATIAAVRDEALRSGGAVVPVHQGRRGHPLAVPGRLRDAIVAMSPTSTLKAALLALDVVPAGLITDDPGVLRDVDVRSDLPDDMDG